MPDFHYESPKLVALYDLDSGWSEDRDFYLELASSATMDILDLGCGTGLLANAYASRNHNVTGADPSEEMLEAASKKSHGKKITWVQSYSQNFSAEKYFDLIVMTGHAFQVLLSDKDISATFETMHKHLTKNGRIVFESRNPEINWATNWDYEIEIDLPDFKVKESRHYLYMEEDKMFFELKYQFPNEVLTSKSKLRFLPYKEIEKRLREQGLKVENVYGDWDKSPFVLESSEEMIFIVSKE